MKNPYSQPKTAQPSTRQAPLRKTNGRKANVRRGHPLEGSAPKEPARDANTRIKPASEVDERAQSPAIETKTAGNPQAVVHLIPVGLGDSPVEAWLPEEVCKVARRLKIYIAENAKTARAFLKLVGTEHPLQDITIHTLSRDTNTAQIRSWLKVLPGNGELGVVSEAGCPAVADPGARVVAEAHALGLRVAPWVGPSSLLLGLMASGLDGQRFAFHGYAPVRPDERARTLKTWETNSRQLEQTQLFIETPYRNEAMFQSLIQTLKGDTRLCIARSLTTSHEWIRTHTIAEWKQQPVPELAKHPTLFLFLATR